MVWTDNIDEQGVSSEADARPVVVRKKSVVAAERPFVNVCARLADSRNDQIVSGIASAMLNVKMQLNSKLILDAV